ncbi:MAG: hypothetical protein KDC73_11485 [Ignavibacteriae bacterium]|nr:hypothetical protein [Ignavibacteriota bacterium]MCB9243537.1 hypothetical protein [Ignavibacteriales bacterium]
MDFENFKKLEEIKPTSFIIAGLFLLTFLISGSSYIFFFYKDLFNTLDWFRLILLSASIPAPMFIFTVTILYKEYSSEVSDIEKDIDDIEAKIFNMELDDIKNNTVNEEIESFKKVKEKIELTRDKYKSSTYSNYFWIASLSTLITIYGSLVLGFILKLLSIQWSGKIILVVIYIIITFFISSFIKSESKDFNKNKVSPPTS